eukprot:GHVS01038271.1.p1 GENE.GHVS01038271.1~~GHVS01038271.1.p1  ORF type:complete len:603 (+),score=76.73 GHVS01038271.1:95-1903(+)
MNRPREYHKAVYIDKSPDEGRMKKGVSLGTMCLLCTVAVAVLCWCIYSLPPIVPLSSWTSPPTTSPVSIAATLPPFFGVNAFKHNSRRLYGDKDKKEKPLTEAEKADPVGSVAANIHPVGLEAGNGGGGKVAGGGKMRAQKQPVVEQDFVTENTGSFNSNWEYTESSNSESGESGESHVAAEWSGIVGTDQEADETIKVHVLFNPNYIEAQKQFQPFVGKPPKRLTVKETPYLIDFYPSSVINEELANKIQSREKSLTDPILIVVEENSEVAYSTFTKAYDMFKNGVVVCAIVLKGETPVTGNHLVQSVGWPPMNLANGDELVEESWQTLLQAKRKQRDGWAITFEVEKDGGSMSTVSESTKPQVLLAKSYTVWFDAILISHADLKLSHETLMEANDEVVPEGIATNEEQQVIEALPPVAEQSPPTPKKKGQFKTLLKCILPGCTSGGKHEESPRSEEPPVKNRQDISLRSVISCVKEVRRSITDWREVEGGCLSSCDWDDADVISLGLEWNFKEEMVFFVYKSPGNTNYKQFITPSFTSTATHTASQREGYVVTFKPNQPVGLRIWPTNDHFEYIILMTNPKTIKMVEERPVYVLIPPKGP